MPSECSSAADPGAVQTNIMREIPPSVSTMAFTAMKVLGVLQSSESGVSSIVDAALAPPVSIQYMFFQDCVFSELTDLLGERLNQNQSGFCNMTE